MSLPGRLVETAGARLYVHRDGGGAPLVLVHGYLVSHYYFKPVLPEAARRFDCIAVDLPGQGESDRPSPQSFTYDLPTLADRVVEAVEALGVKRFRLWGHSFGGGTAITIAARHPDRVERLLVEDALIYPIPLPPEGKLGMLPGIGPFIFKKLYAKRDLARHFRRAYKDQSIASPELVDYYWERFNRGGAREANYALFRTINSLVDNTGDPGRIQCPTLIVWGEEDRIIPLAHGKRLQKQIPGARLEVIGACGHSPHEERPEEILRVALPFLAGEADGNGAERAHG